MIIARHGEESTVDSLLDPLDKDNLYLGDSGNPYGYYNTNKTSTLTKAPELYGDFKNIARNGGSNGSSFEVSEEESKTREMTYGFTFELAIAGGFKAKGFEMHLGGFVDLQAMFGGSVTTTNGKGTAYSGSVSGIYTDEMKADGLDPNKWGFAWALASWDSGITNKSPNIKGSIPVIGYVLKDVYSPSAPVEDLALDFNREDDSNLSFDLSWNNGDNTIGYDSKTSGYNIYLYNNLQNKFELLTTIDDPKTTSYKYTVSHDGREYYNFIVYSFYKKYETDIPSEGLPKYIQQFMPVASNSVISISKTSTSEDGLIDTYTILFADYSTQTFTVTNGRAIINVEKTSTNSETGVDTYTITFSDGLTQAFTIQNGVQGPKGEDGISIVEVKELSIEGDTVNYEILMTDGSTHQFSVKNGRGIASINSVSFNSETGIETFRITFTDGTYTDFELRNALPHQIGEDGVGINSIEKSSSDGLVDTYTIHYTDGSMSSFVVTNGEQGIQGIQGNPGEDGHTPIITIGENGNWFIDGVDSGSSSRGEKSEQGVGVKNIQIDEEGNFIFTLTDGTVINAGKAPVPSIEQASKGCKSSNATIFAQLFSLITIIGIFIKKKH